MTERSLPRFALLAITTKIRFIETLLEGWVVLEALLKRHAHVVEFLFGDNRRDVGYWRRCFPVRGDVEP
jgi:hypothetical protein